MSKTLFMIHGMWVGSWCWDNYRDFFEKAGYRTIAPDLPYHGCGILRPDPRLGKTSLRDYFSFLCQEIEKLDEPPIVIGHSLGGLLAQMLAARGMVEKAVLLTPAAPAGIITARPSVLKICAPIMLLPNFWNRSIPATYPLAKYSILNGFDDESEAKRVFEKIGYESGRVLFEVGFWALDKNFTTYIDANDVQCPMLILSASEDRIMPASVVFHIWRKYLHCAKYHCLDGFAHWLVGEPNWQDVALRIKNWLENENQ